MRRLSSEEGGVKKKTSLVSSKVTRSLLHSSLLLLSAAIDVASAPGQHISSLSAARVERKGEREMAGGCRGGDELQTVIISTSIKSRSTSSGIVVVKAVKSAVK